MARDGGFVEGLPVPVEEAQAMRRIKQWIGVSFSMIAVACATPTAENIENAQPTTSVVAPDRCSSHYASTDSDGCSDDGRQA